MEETPAFTPPVCCAHHLPFQGRQELSTARRFAKEGRLLTPHPSPAVTASPQGEALPFSLQYRKAPIARASAAQPRPRTAHEVRSRRPYPTAKGLPDRRVGLGRGRAAERMRHAVYGVAKDLELARTRTWGATEGERPNCVRQSARKRCACGFTQLSLAVEKRRML